jgi:methyl-accepting chemotaxis protein
MAIRYKIGLIVAGLSFIILSMFLFTWYTTSAQKADGLVINLAGRQRMLSQKMSKEILLYATIKDAKQKDNTRLSVNNTIKIFDLTLSALIDSGKAPLSLDLNGDYATIPKSSEPAHSQLLKVNEIWKKFSHHINNVSNQNKDIASSLEYVTKNNINLLQEMNKAVGMLQKLAEKKVQRLIFFQFICLAVGIILMVVSIIQVSHIVKNLLQSSATAKLMKNGDLTKRFDTADKPVNKLDELDFLGYNLNSFAQSLQKNMKKINKDALSLNTFSGDMRVIAKELSDETNASAQKTIKVASNAENMSEDMNAVAAAMEELSTNTQLIAESTSQMSETSKDIAQNADKAASISNKAVKKVDTASSRVDDLGNATTKISQVSEAITDISEQTNLLALNATIEAARAGEAGKGFAVVANEIKSLANQTTEATEQIKENIGWIQGSTASTVEDIKEIAQVINEVNKIVKNISAAVEDQTHTIADISANVSQGAQAVQEVSSNVANTSAASVEIAGDINDVSESVNHVSSNTTNIADSAKQLSQLAEGLHSLVGHFIIE